MMQALLPLLALAAGSTLAAPPAAAAGEGRVVDQVVAVLRFPNSSETHAITWSRLAEEARIALVSRGAAAAAVRPLDAAALRAGLEWLIDQTVLMDEVTRLNVLDVERRDVLQELARFRARFARPEEYQAFLAKLELSSEELMVVLRRMLRVQRYVESRVSRAARVRDAEVEAYYQQHQKEFSGRDLAAVREAVRAHLAEERVKTDVGALVSELRSRCEIRLLADLDRLGDGS